MATIPLTITVPDAQMSRVQAACRATFGQVDNGAGGLRDMTNAEIIERLRQDVISMIKGMVFTREAEAKRAEAAAIQQVDAT